MSREMTEYRDMDGNLQCVIPADWTVFVGDNNGEPDIVVGPPELIRKIQQWSRYAVEES